MIQAIIDFESEVNIIRLQLVEKFGFEIYEINVNAQNLIKLARKSLECSWQYLIYKTIIKSFVFRKKYFY